MSHIVLSESTLRRNNVINTIKELQTHIKEIGLEIHVIRHAKTLNNLDRRIQGRAAIHEPILPVDNIDDQKAIDMYKNIEFDRVYCSPALRAIQTATLLGHVNINIIKNMNEISWGDIDLLSILDTASYAEINNIWFSTSQDNDIEAKINNGESLLDFAERIVDTFSFIVKDARQSNAKKILLVGHGLWLGILLAMFDIHRINSLDYKPSHIEMVKVQ